MDFPYIEVPDEALQFLGELLPGTRIYQKDGTHDERDAWSSTVFEICGSGALSPGGVASRVRVSRAAVHNRMKAGKLTAFFFYNCKERGLFGKRKVPESTPSIYIPASEAKAWAKDLQRRALEEGKITEEELEEESPKTLNDFHRWKSKWLRDKQPKIG